jgi:hypothetical protein
MPGGPGCAPLHHRRDLPGTRLGCYDVRLTRAMVVQVLLVVLLAGSVVAMSPARASTASTAGLTARTCTSIYTGDRVRRLDVCTRGYIGPGYVTGVVEMHTYRWLAKCPDAPGSCWRDSQSQSITMNQSYLGHTHLPGGYVNWWWGNDFTPSHRCYLNAPTGTKTCSVANAIRVAFYSDGFLDDRCGNEWYNEVWKVSWRDDRGLAHYWNFGDHGLPLDQGWYTS